MVETNETLTNIELSLTAGDGPSAALKAFDQLPESAQKDLADWKQQLEARQEVDEAIAEIAKRFTAKPATVNP